jgi:signal transduction histidine kinase
VLEWEPSLKGSDLRVELAAVGRQAQLFGALRLPDGTWLRFRAVEPIDDGQPGWHRILIALLPATVLLIVGTLLFRHTLRPMKMLARAAERVGRSSELSLPEAGPLEVRRVIRAFNAMQGRIQRLISERTQALAAVGHDLRTPLARMELRLDGARLDSETRAAMSADINEMGDLLRSLQIYLGGEGESLPIERIDLAVMASTIIDSARDLGQDAFYDGPESLEIRARPVSIRRAISNLVENALHYGHSARLSIRQLDGETVIHVDDDGPGIPSDKIEQVLQPFVRLDEGRARNTKGMGLGLAIVSNAVRAEGGVFVLENRPEGGLRASIRLARPAD